MAKVKHSIFNIKGKLDGLSFYKINGKEVVRKSYGPSSEIIKNNPNYASVKKNNKEFAGATQISKLIRTSLGSVGKQYQDAYMASRLTGVCRKIISKGKGQFGEREANLKENQLQLVGFPLIKNRPINKVCRANYELQQSNDQKSIRIKIPNISNTDFAVVQSFATHFKYHIIAVMVASYTYNREQDKYLPNTLNYNGHTIRTETDYLDIDSPHNNINLTLNMSKPALKDADCSITIWFGINIVNRDSQNDIPLENKNARAMQCIAVL